MTRAKSSFHLLTLILLGFLVSGCTQNPKWKLIDLTGIMPPLEFTLHNDQDQPVTADKYKGKIVMLYFGYTHCPDVCPTTLVRIANALKELGSEADQVQPLFVSVDPARDTPKILREYPRAFSPRIAGLSGDEKSLRKLTKRYRVTYGLGKPDANGNYEVTHSSAIFIFDKKGETRLMARSDDSADAIAHDLKELISES
ncbi:MAG: SCO family protein [Acidiferrobacterales bacterium]